MSSTSLLIPSHCARTFIACNDLKLGGRTSYQSEYSTKDPAAEEMMTNLSSRVGTGCTCCYRCSRSRSVNGPDSSCLPTPEMDFKWDVVLRKIVAACPRNVAAWCAARMTVAAGVIYGHMESNPNPPTDHEKATMMEQMLISRWNAGMKQLWRGMFEQADGTAAFRGDDVMDYLQKQGKFFSGN